jgi:transcriptional regulator with XRE-family HTH domain
MSNEIHTLVPNTSWQSPIPFIKNIKEDHAYPIKALPTFIRKAIEAYQPYGQQPLPLIACSALANVSLACQALANVARDRMLEGPISLYFLVVADSGERKSAADNTFSQAIRQWERKNREKLMPKIKALRSLHQAWHVEKESILSQIRRAAFINEDTEYLKERLIEIIEREPTLPLLPVLFFEDATQEALAAHLAHGWPSASLWSDEGALILSGSGMQNNTAKFVALLNRLWDGKSFIAHRKTSSSFTIEHRRLTVSIMMQPLVLNQMLAKQEGISRQSGFLARSLIAYPGSSMGERFYQEPPEALIALAHFHQRLTDCLDECRSLDHTGCHQLPTLTFSTAAKNTWIQFFNHVESGLTKDSFWFSIKDFASKAAENTARLSALFHLFEGKEGSIDSEDVERAAEIMRWHLFETRRLLGPRITSHEHHDAIKVIHWLQKKGLPSTTSRELQREHYQFLACHPRAKLSKNFLH